MSNEHPAPVTAVVCGDLNLLRCFAGTGIRPLVLGCEPDELVFHSRRGRRGPTIGSPLTEPDYALERLLALGRTLMGRPALFFDSDPMLLLVSRNRHVLEPHFRFLLPDAALVEDTVDKVRFAGLARRLELPVPRTLLSRQVSGADEAAAQLSLPCIFKPICHVGWYTTDVVRQVGPKPYKALPAHTPQEFRQLWAGMSQYASDFVVQEYIPGADDCIHSFHAYLDRHGTPRGRFVGRKIRTYPKTAGVSTYLRLVHDAEVMELGLDIVRRLGLIGPVKLDFKRDPVRRRLYLLEVNARFNLWSHLGAACGINLPHIAYQNLHGKAVVPQSEYRTHVRWLAFGNDLRAFLRDYRPDGEASWPGYLWSLCRTKVYDVFSWTDPIPAAVGLWRASRSFVASRLTKRLRHPPAADTASSPPAHLVGAGQEDPTRPIE